MAPVTRELARRPAVFQPLLVTTAQHRELLDQALLAFSLRTHTDLALMTHDQPLPVFTARAVAGVADLLDAIAPDAVLIHGDTTTAFATALAAFYNGLLIGHVEAGLRSNQRVSPFPEEMNRRLIGTLAQLHFAPTQGARANLLREGVEDATIFVTGNTSIDALLTFDPETSFDDSNLERLVADDRRILLVTAHRRETWGAPLVRICAALREITRRFADTHVVFPVHPNPNVREVVYHELRDARSITLIEPVSYADFMRLVHRSYVLLTDSGGLQEEAPAMRKPVLVLRETTERPELLDVGAGLLVGTDTTRIIRAVSRLLQHHRTYERMASAPNPFGDGKAAVRIVDLLEQRLSGAAAPDTSETFALAAS